MGWPKYKPSEVLLVFTQLIGSQDQLPPEIMAATAAEYFAGALLLIGVVIAHAVPVVEPYKDGECYCFFLFKSLVSNLICLCF